MLWGSESSTKVFSKQQCWTNKEEGPSRLNLFLKLINLPNNISGLYTSAATLLEYRFSPVRNKQVFTLPIQPALISLAECSRRPGLEAAASTEVVWECPLPRRARKCPSAPCQPHTKYSDTQTLTWPEREIYTWQGTKSHPGSTSQTEPGVGVSQWLWIFAHSAAERWTDWMPSPPLLPIHFHPNPPHQHGTLVSLSLYKCQWVSCLFIC